MFALLKPSIRPLMAICLTAPLFFWSEPAAAAPEADDANDIGFYGEVEVGHSDNIFQLTGSQQFLLEAGDPEDSESGRFDDMNSVSDTVISPSIGMKYDTLGFRGEDLKLSARLKYNYHTENDAKSYPEAKIRLKNDIDKKSDLLLELNFLFDFYKKNYLAGVNDENDNGNISRDERVYQPAVYEDYEGVVTYEREIYKDKNAPLSRIDFKPFFGFGSRTYNSPFDNRDRTAIFGGLEAGLEFLSKIDLALTYRYERTRTPGNEELVLFDETRFDTDVNGDGEIERNAPLVTRIDRSANRHTFEIKPSFKVNKDLKLFLGYETRMSDYTSDNPLDLDHYENTSYRTRFEAGLQYDFSKSWTTECQYRMTDDEDDEDGDYSENCFTLSIRYAFP